MSVSGHEWFVNGVSETARKNERGNQRKHLRHLRRTTIQSRRSSRERKNKDLRRVGGGGSRGSNEPPLQANDGGTKNTVKLLEACDPDDFPNLYIILKIAATPPVTSCECERSISPMRRLNNYMKCTMGESRLSSLTIMHIKYDMPIDLDELVNLFERLHPRLMQLQNSALRNGIVLLWVDN